MYDDHPMLAKIRKLLAKAENDATTAEEAELYTAKAAQLVADYGIDQALLNAEAPGRDGDGVSDRLVTVEAPYAADKADLLATVACRLRCRTVRVTERTAAGREFAVHLFGHEPDLVRTDLLFTSLLLQASTWMMRTPVPPLEHKAAFRRSWLAGFRMSIARRLEDAERVAEQSASSSAVGTDGTGKSARGRRAWSWRTGWQPSSKPCETSTRTPAGPADAASREEACARAGSRASARISAVCGSPPGRHGRWAEPAAMVAGTCFRRRDLAAVEKDRGCRCRVSD